MFDFPALDVALGLIFLYLVLALVCTSVNEAIATGVGLRARFLQLGLLNLLSAGPRTTNAGIATARAFYAHPLVQTMIRPTKGPDPSLDPTAVSRWWRKPPYPSYLPSRMFVAAIADIAAAAPARLDDAADADEAAKARRRLAAVADDVERGLAAIPNEALSEALLSLYRAAGRDAGRFALDAARWFDDSMERVSGWYKRRVRLILLVVAALLVVLLNADSLAAARVLWRDDAARAAAVRQAEAAAAAAPADGDAVGDAVERLDLPLGWEFSFGDDPAQVPDDVVAWIAKALGLAVTTGAVMLGAPFWFDLLSKVTRIRGTGAPPPATDAIRSGDADQRRAGPRLPDHP